LKTPQTFSAFCSSDFYNSYPVASFTFVCVVDFALLVFM